MIERAYLHELLGRINEPRKFIQVLYGPRQVGKTTLVLQLLSKVSTETVYETADTVSAVDAKWFDRIACGTI
jgi:predicted AAA+ superfamily ATPase